MNIGTVEGWTQSLAEVVKTSPDWLSSLILLISASAEYIFPPFPGDTIIVAAGFFAARRAISIIGVVVGVLLGSVAGCWLAYMLGHHAQRHPRTRQFLMRVFDAENFGKLNHTFHRHGHWLLLFNRFLPAARGIVLIGAGLSGLPLGRVLVLGSLSAILWNSLLVALGYIFSLNLEGMLRWIYAYSIVFYGIVVILIVGFGIVISVRRKRARAQDQSQNKGK